MFGTGLLLRVFREIENAAEQSIEDEKQQIMGRLRQLHLKLERGVIDETQFDHEETALLERLETLKRMRR